MCHSPEALPPKAAREGFLLESRRTVLETSDGGLAPAFLAKTLPGPTSARTDVEREGVSQPVVYRAESSPSRPGVVILPDQRGLHWFYERLAENFADAGIAAVAVDFYHRTAGTAFRGDDFDFAPHRGEVTTEHLVADADAGAAALRSEGVDRVYALGFCFGGRGALLQAVEPGWAGVVAFYGFPTRESGDGRSPISDAHKGNVRCPVLGLFGAEDDSVGRDAPHEYQAALAEAGVQHEVAIYPGAGHSFFDRKMAEQGENCQDAWRRILEFVV
jgi:carboxymethylenebutenolidase